LNVRVESTLRSEEADMASTDGKEIVLRGRGINGGCAEGRALVSKLAFGFTHGVDPETGEVTDVRHDLRNQNLRDRILVFPVGKSSSSGGMYILETVRCGNAPAAVINVETEPVIGAGFIMADLIYNKKVPVVDHLDCNPCDVIKTGDYVWVDGDNGIVRVTRE
jgi:predicted aconitase with swiveling domain